MSEVTSQYSSIMGELNSAVRDVNILEASSQLQSPILKSESTQGTAITAVLTTPYTHIPYNHRS
jgi:hypothetical protein